MRTRFPVKRRQGHTRGELRTTLPDDVDVVGLDPGVMYTHQRPTATGLFAQALTWRVTPDGVEEEVALTAGWGWGLLVAVVVIAIGPFLGIVSTVPSVFIVGVQMVGLVATVWLLLEAMWAGYLSEQELTIESTTTPYSGVLGLILLHGITAVLATGPLALLLSGIALLLGIAYCQSPAVERRLAVLSSWLTDRETAWPVAARRHILFAMTGALALFGGSNLYLDVQLANRSLLVGLLIVGVAWIGLLLWTVNARRAARLHVSTAVGITGALVVAVPLVAKPTVAITSNHTTPLAMLGQLLVGGSLLGLWGLLAKHQLQTQTDAIARFISTGRQVDTETAALLAYGVMISSAMLGLGALIATSTVVLVVVGGGPHVGVLVMGISAIPLGYFLLGSASQLWGLYRQMVEIRRRGTRKSPADLGLPIDPGQDLWVVETDGFLAGAYYDPFLSAIVLSRGAIETLSTEQLATVVAHEESHFVHRGAWLQFLFTLLCSFTLLGKNVVYSIYDFREREFTADQYAVEQLTDSLGEKSRETLLSVLDAHRRGELPPADSPLVGFFPTLTWAPSQYLQHGRELFALFYGGFAGQVHPTISERQTELEVENRS